MKRFLILLMLPLLTGCLSAVPPPSMSAIDLAHYKLVAAEVENAQIIQSWPAEEKAFLATAESGPDIARRLETESASHIPAATSFFKRSLEQKLDAALRKSVGDAFSGQQPAVARITLLAFDIPSVGRRILAGGTANMKIQIDVLDAKTRQVLISYPGEYRDVHLMGGVLAPVAASVQKDDVADELIAVSMKDFRRWLVERPHGTELAF